MIGPSSANTERPYWVAWSQISSVGPVRLQRLWRHFGSLETAWRAAAADLMAVEGIGLATAMDIDQGRSAIDPSDTYLSYVEANPDFWTPSDSDYPRLMLDSPDPPPVLHYRGKVDLNENHGKTLAVAIVGTRQPTEYGRRWTYRISQTLAHAGVTVISGLASGVDAIAHQAALDAGGRTLAVMGTGVNLIYPRRNRTLAERILPQGLLLSEYPNGTPPDRARFPRRNRIIAGLSRAVLILEAPQKSGALITARVAKDYGRDIYALPGTLDNDRAFGCLALIEQGATMILGESSLLERLGVTPRRAKKEVQADPTPQAPPQAPPGLSPELAQVLSAIKTQPILLDHISQQTGLDPGPILAALAQLEMMDLVQQLPGMRYQRC